MHSSKNEQIISQLLYFLSVELRAGTAAVHKTSTGKSVTYRTAMPILEPFRPICIK